MKYPFLKLFTVGITLLLFGGCGSQSETEETQSGTSLSCSVSGSVSAGDISGSYSTVTVSNISVYSTGSSTGKYILTLPNLTAITVNSSYTYSGSISLQTAYSGGVSAQVTVQDPSTGEMGYCTLSLGSTTSSSSAITLSASPSTSQTKGSYITLTASASSVSSPVFSFSQASNYPSYVSASNASNGYLTITSSIAQTVVVTVSMVSNSSGYATSTQTITLTFTETTASTSSLTCSLTHGSGTYYRGTNIFFYISSNTGEQLKLIAWNPGEAWDNGVGPSFPLTLPMYGSYSYFYGAYSYTGSKYVQVIAESVSRPGVYCNGGSYLTDTVYVY